MVYVFEGKGKGKTSAALGVVMRMLLLGNKVEWISWYKEESWKTSEMGLAAVFEKTLRMHWAGCGFYGGPMDKSSYAEHKKSAERALLLAKKSLSKKEKSGGGISLLVLDEALKAVNDGLLNVKEVIDLIKSRGKIHLILTGHVCPEEIRGIADLVTEMKKIKHPFDKGVLAVRGLDF